MFKKKNKNKDFWEGKYFDLWSITHFVSGVIFAFILIYLGFELAEAMIIVIIAGFLWELFEYFLKMKEKKTNRMTDVLFMVVGFKLFYDFLPEFFEQTYEIPFFYLFSIILSIYIILCFLGWKAYKNRV